MANVALREEVWRIQIRTNLRQEYEPRGPREPNEPIDQVALRGLSEPTDPSERRGQSEPRELVARNDPNVRIVRKRIQKWSADHLDANAMGSEVLANRLGIRIEIPPAEMPAEKLAMTIAEMLAMRNAAMIEGKSVAQMFPVAAQTVARGTPR